MIEALLLMSAILAVILIVYYIGKSQPDTNNRTLGIFSYVDVSDDLTTKSNPKSGPNA